MKKRDSLGSMGGMDPIDETYIPLVEKCKKIWNLGEGTWYLSLGLSLNLRKKETWEGLSIFGEWFWEREVMGIIGTFKGWFRLEEM